MNISYNWLKDYIKTDLSPQELGAALTSIGLETGTIEKVESIKGGLEGLFVGEVLTCGDHPNSDHLHITSVDVGTGEALPIVCGAPNVAKGQKVIVALIGTTLFSGEETFTIKKTKIRGIESNGMICAEDEIGVGTDHAGIIVLPENTPVGMPAKEYYQVENDYILEVDITPNRIDAASHFGVARDLAAYLLQNGYPCELTKPGVEEFQTDDQADGVTVVVDDKEGCPRYSGITIRDITVKESPEWLKNRLESIGLRSINNVVDVTNYVLHELGQPLHAFDLKEIKGNKVIVKTLPQGSKFVTLDGVERTLDAADLMICNDTAGMCIAGVLGGLKSGVTESTTDMFLESAYFNPTRIRKTARRHGLNTDASFRFERGCDPNTTLYVLKRAALLIQEVAGGKICGEIRDVYPDPIDNTVLELSLTKVNELVGKDIPSDIVINILKNLEIEILNEHKDLLEISIPTYRVDVGRDVDVIEDILRIYGYNNVEINDSLKSNLSYRTEVDESYSLQEIISEQLTGGGFSEIMNNSLTASAYYSELTVFPESECVKLKNPLSAELNVMRQTLLFGGLESIRYNKNRKNSDLSFYEFGNVYSYHADKHKDGDSLSGIEEVFKLGMWLTGNKVAGSWLRPDEPSSVFEMKAYVEGIFSRLGILRRKPLATSFSDELFSAGLIYKTVSGRKLGMFGIVHKNVCKRFDIDSEVYYAELEWNNLMKEAETNRLNYKELSKYPSVKRDLALLLDKNVLFEEIKKIAFETDKKILKEVTLFDVYEGKNLPEDKKSYAVSFILQDEEKTLNDKQIENIMQKIQRNLEQRLGAQLRG